MLKEQYEAVKQTVEEEAAKAGREAGEVTLIAVSKTKPVWMLEEVYACGCRHFGENKVQELVDKYEKLPKDIKWHMIGHLQRNKVKYLIGKTFLIHSVDSVRLAEEISKEAVKRSVSVDILIEVNVAMEESKFGTTLQDAETLTRQIAALPGICVKGYMTIAPFVQDPEENRQYFRLLKQLSVDIIRKNIDNVSVEYLSMGMTNDYRVAISEGADFVRVGTGIFGERDYSKQI
ncbi:MAG: YggS family pyridoxal phosphate-dependent enzyme [Lachnospiraceae bacterium]|nr:YggS family pyridoxal phosphate-dependent enzyme [Lachnospiraceae bacterium]